MKVSIGILAWNEERYIERTLSSLFQQSVFTTRCDETKDTSWEVVIVPNGCTDNTANIATKALKEHCSRVSPHVKIKGKVFELKEAGKSNAWNVFIHDYASKDSDIIIMMDADIIFNHIDTIFNAVKELRTNPSARAVVGTPLKHFVNKEKKNFIEWISSAYSRQKHELQKRQGNPGIAGSFYCARADVLRQVWMPPGLAGEDGFLRAMICTDFFRTEPDAKTIVRVENASHFYEGLTSLRNIYRHELRMVIGTALNCYFCWDFLLFATPPDGPGAGYLIKTQLDHDPDWYRKYIDNTIKTRGWWVLPKGFMTKRFSQLKSCPAKQLPLKLLIATIALLLDIPIMITANHKLKKGAIGFW